MIFALVGNQNSGKTTLFNQLTGSNQHVGNFPGVTVDRKDGQSVFNRLKKDDLAVWLDEYEYSLSDVWEKNIIGGQL